MTTVGCLTWHRLLRQDYGLVFLVELPCKLSSQVTLLSTEALQPQMCKPSPLVYSSQDPAQDVCCQQPYAVKRWLCLNRSARAVCLAGCTFLTSCSSPPCHADPPVCPGQHAAAARGAGVSRLAIANVALLF